MAHTHTNLLYLNVYDLNYLNTIDMDYRCSQVVTIKSYLKTRLQGLFWQFYDIEHALVIPIDVECVWLSESMADVVSLNGLSNS